MCSRLLMATYNNTNRPVQCPIDALIDV